MEDPKKPATGGAQPIVTCTMSEADPFIVPPASGSCQGQHFDNYWANHNAQHDPDVPIRVYKPGSTKYEDYSAAKHAGFSFIAYHERTPEGSDVRQAPKGPWIGIILDYNG